MKGRACAGWVLLLVGVFLAQSAAEWLIDRLFLCQTLQDHLLSSLTTLVPEQMGFVRTLYHCTARAQSAGLYKQWLQLPLWLPAVSAMAYRQGNASTAWKAPPHSPHLIAAAA